MNHDDPQQNAEPKAFWNSRYAIGFLIMGAIASYFLVSEHRAHFFGALPFLLLLACPLMHVFMHHGHGGHAGEHRRHTGGEEGSNTPTTAQASRTERQP